MAKLGVHSLLFLALSASAVLPVGLLGVSQAQRRQRDELEATDRQALAAARSAADLVSLSMLGFAHASESLAAQVAAVPGLERDGLRVALAAHVLHHPEFLGAYAADASGLSLAAVSAGGQLTEAGLNYRDRDYFREILATQRTAISRVQMGRVTHVVSVTISSPIVDASGRFLGITCTSLDLAEITEQAKKSVTGMSEGRVVLTDAEGQIIADSSGGGGAKPRDVSRAALFRHVRGPGEAQLRSGVDEAGQSVRAMAVGLRAPVTGWQVVAMAPQAVVEAQARALRNRTAGLALVLIFAALGLAAWLSGWLARPLRALAKTANALTGGELNTPLPVVSSSAPREVQQLTQAMSSMISTLQGHSLRLEELVATRTAELSSANQELQGALATIRENERLIREDIAKARLFQERMLPTMPRRPGLDIAARYAALAEVSGDIYDVSELADGRLRVFIVDATGHGVQASMRTIFLKSAYDRLKLDGADPASLLSRLNELLVAEFPEGELHSEACCLDLTTTPTGAEVCYANAGNTPLFVCSPQGAPREQYVGGPLLGVERVIWPACERFQLARGELLLVCSDGLLEQLNESRARFDSRLGEFRLAAESAEESLARLLTDFDAFRGLQPVADDLTVIAILVGPLLDVDQRAR